jgi:hypothetical protein
MTEEPHPIAGLTDAALQAMLKRAIRNTLILGMIPAAVLIFVSGWRNAAMLAVGTAISAASILEQKTPASAPVVVLFFVLRLTVFAGVIYVSLKCFHGSVIALLCGLGLAVVAIAWEALRLLRD